MEGLPKEVKKEVSRLRSEVRKLQQTTLVPPVKKEMNPFTGAVTGNYWSATGMPWATGDGRKAVLTEYFWQPIRGQPRRVDTNELRMFSQTFWVSSCVKTVMDEIASLEWDIVPSEDFEYDWVEEGIKDVKQFFKKPNKNDETWGNITKAILKDILEIDAGVLVKVFDVSSYDFEKLEPKSGAPMLKPLGQRKMTELYARDGASFLKEIDKFGFCLGYWQYSYQIPAHPMWFNRDEIVYFNEHPRSMSCYGYARTQSVLDVIKSLHYSTLYNKRFFEETSIPDGALSLLDTSEEEMQAFRNYWNNDFKGQPHKVAVINKDIKWNPFNITQRELEFLETQKWYYNLVISAFGLTPSEMGITDDVNRATSATQSELVKRKGIRPFLKLIESYINIEILPEFGYEGIEFQFIYDDPAEKAARLSNWNLELTMGVKTINEVRLEMGLEPIEGGDVSNNMSSVLGSGGMPNSSGDRQEPESPPKAQADAAPKKAEEAQSPGYKDNLKRSEGKASKTASETEEVNARVLMPYSSDKRPVGSFKGVDDGQYYREQPIVQPRRPSGAMYQPQNVSTDLPNPWTGLRTPDTNPSQMGSDYRRPGVDTYENINLCGSCGQNTMAAIESEENLEHDYKCSSCGARKNAQEKIDDEALARMYDVVTRNNVTTPVGIPNNPLLPKSASGNLHKNFDGFTVKEYVGMDTEKFSPYSTSYAASKGYSRLLREYLGDLNAERRSKIISVLKNGIKSGETISDLAKKVGSIVGDVDRGRIIARTEIMRLANEGNLQRMEERGVEKVEYVSAPEDGRLCEECYSKDHKIYTLKEARGMLPLHPMCRCTLTDYYEIPGVDK